MAVDEISVRLEVKTGEAGEALKRVVNSLEGFHLQNASDTGPTDLLIMEPGTDLKNDFELIQTHLHIGTVGEVFITSDSSDQGILVQALRSGAREFFPQPIQVQEVVQALQRFRERRAKSGEACRIGKNGMIIDVIGSKGGVGNTTIAVNLAFNLAQIDRTKCVALIDLNLVLGEVPLFLGIEPAYHWGEIAKNMARLDATFLMSVLHKHSSGIFVLPSPSQFHGKHDATPEAIESLLRLMKTVFDYIVVDSGHLADTLSMRILEMADHVLVTAILSLPCLSNVNRFIRLFNGLTYPPAEDSIKIIVNRYLKNSDISLKDAEASIGKKIFWTVPNDFKSTMSAINQGKTLSEVAAKSDVARSLRELAERFAVKEEGQSKGSSLLGRLFSKR